jgi:hypothetical protein
MVFPTFLGDHEVGFFVQPNSVDKPRISRELAAQLRLETHEGAKVFSEVGPADRFIGRVRVNNRIPDILAVTQGDIGVAAALTQTTVLTEETNKARGVHHRLGLVLLNSDDALVIEEPAVEDITPTILALLDIKPPHWMQGSSLLDLSPTKVLPRGAPDSRSAEPELSREEEEAIEDHLRGLGYVE